MGHCGLVLGLVHRWPSPLLEGRLRARYERFLAEVRLADGRTVRAHCVNPGRMEGMIVEGARVWLSESPNPGRALRFTWELVELDGRLVGANTSLPNALVRTVLEHRLVPGFEDLTRVIPEQRFGRGHRADFRLETRRGAHWVEVKNCHLVYPDGLGYFPDSASERATQHVEALARRVQRGDRATVLFTLQRDDARGLRPSALHAPDFARAVRRAARLGVGFRALRFLPTLEGISLLDEVPVEVHRYAVEPLVEWSRAFDDTSGWVRKDGRIAGRSVT
ncbi:MAG: DNA/RNA nuclease SfsA [Myxococcaceae bacterium]|nr:DNA/RNA nuclease SfsA [Myxococcaceae bacterium]